MSLRLGPLMGNLGTSPTKKQNIMSLVLFHSWKTLEQDPWALGSLGPGLPNKLKGLSPLLLRQVQPQVGGVVYNTPFLDLLRLNSNIIGTLVMLRGMLECVTWHLHIGEVPATVWIGNACGGLHLWISQIVIV